MILAGVTLVAGSRHKKYAAGQSIPAILFVDVQSDDELELVAVRELSERGWASMAIEHYKTVTNYEQFNGQDTAEAGAFRDALETGFGVVVYPE